MNHKMLQRMIVTGMLGGGLNKLSLDFTSMADGLLNGFVTPGSVAISNGALVITPTAGTEQYADPGLEANYTNGKCDSLGTLVGTPTVAQSADVHGGAKAQLMTPVANNDTIRYVGAASITGNWYRGSAYCKRTAGAAGQLRLKISHGNGAGYVPMGAITTPAYSNQVRVTRAVSTNQMMLSIVQGGTTFDTIITDDWSIKPLTTSTMAAYKSVIGKNYHVSIVPRDPQEGSGYGVWVCVDNPNNPQNGVLAWYEDARVNLDKVVAGTWTNLLTIAKSVSYAGNAVGCKRAGDEFSLFFGGVQLGATQTISDVGSCPYVGIFAGDAVSKIGRFDLCDLNTVNILGFGDSKMLATNGPIDKLGGKYREVPLRITTGGVTVHDRKLTIDADLASATGTPKAVLWQISNDMNSMPVKATWKSDAQYIVDAFKVKWPGIKIGFSLPWGPLFVGGEPATLGSWYLEMVADNPGVCFAGPDEKVFLENGDNGATYIGPDNAHPNSHGYFMTANEWRKILAANGL